MNISIFGSGYVGLVTGACLAEVGNHVVCVDIDEDKIARLKNLDVPIYEPGLSSYIERNLVAGRLIFTADMDVAVAHGLFQFIAVGTPPKEDGSADLQYVLAVARSVAERMNDYRIIVEKSTVPVGTADVVRQAIQSVLNRRGKSVEFDVVSNPEFLKEGAAVEDFMKPDRIIIGTENPKATELLYALYAPFNRNHDRLVAMDTRSAELTKYAANIMLASKISLMNELGNLAEALNADIEKVRVGIGSDPRIGYHFIYPGCGFGGSCFPKDVLALERIAQDVGYQADMLKAISAVNNRQHEKLFNKIEFFFNKALDGKCIALWGLAFKPNTGDMRAAPSRRLMEALWGAGVTVKAYDPAAMAEARRLYGDRSDLILCNNASEALQGSDALVVVTEWNEFRSPDFNVIKNTLSYPAIFDGRNIYDPKFLVDLGFDYFAMGRGLSQTN